MIILKINIEALSKVSIFHQRPVGIPEQFAHRIQEGQTGTGQKPMKRQIEGLLSFGSRIETGIAKYTEPDLVTLLDELHIFCALVELRIPIAPEPPPEKKKAATVFKVVESGCMILDT